ncbi:MAG TPA: hypothetical protein VHQ46_00130 [Desulfobacteria bacterium]|nr:hypothetical protein [Desulfobacteria bacterium]
MGYLAGRFLGLVVYYQLGICRVKAMTPQQRFYGLFFPTNALLALILVTVFTVFIRIFFPAVPSDQILRQFLQ